MKIVCVGRNYSEHAKELNNDLPSKPIIFLKPDTAILRNNDNFYLPDFSKNIHYECELVFRICKEGKHIAEKFALSYVDKYTVGIDFTARDLQDECKANAHPWERAKAFDHSAVVGEFINVEAVEDLNNMIFSLSKNGTTVQQGNSSEMIFSLAKLIAEISNFITLKQGDLIYTGTPKGVSNVVEGDLLEGFIGDKKLLSCRIM